MLNGKPLCIDGYCGLGGWAEGFLAEGWRVIGFDTERHDYGTGGYPGALVLQDVLTLHGSQFKDADCLVFSPPCQAYSYMAMPWKRGKAMAVAIRDDQSGRKLDALNALFNACFRIQREASEAAGHHIPMVVENVKGAQPWVGRAAWHYGSFYLWGDVPALMPSTRILKVAAFNFHQQEKTGKPGGLFQSAAVKNNGGGSWFAQAHNTESGHSQNPVTGEGIKQHGSGAALFDKALDERRRNATAGTKATADGRSGYGGDFGWDGTALRRGNSHSSARKAASAQIAKIPYDLSRWIARVYRPEVVWR